MNKSVIALLLVLLCGTTLYGQERLTWTDLADVEFKPKYFEEYDAHFLMPTFGESIKKRSGKKIAIKGYFLDISGSGKVFLLSKNPMATCFFCGAAGPETIIEVAFKEKPTFRTDQVITVEGILQLNDSNAERCNYILDQATGTLVK